VLRAIALERTSLDEFSPNIVQRFDAGISKVLTPHAMYIAREHFQ
jgi:hypothetical protein